MYCYPVWAEIDSKAIAHNCAQVKQLISPNNHFMATVKANGYGHDAIQFARIALKNGANYLGVARIEEGITLRNAGIKAPILIYGYTSTQNIYELIEYNLIPTIFDKEMAFVFSRSASSLGVVLKAHLKIDTGMGRLGLVAVPPLHSHLKYNQQAFFDTLKIYNLPGLKWEGIYTHFAQADNTDKTHALQQLEIFQTLLRDLKKQGAIFPIRHTANSAATIDIKDSHLDMVRPGLMLYGLYPFQELINPSIELKPVMSLKSKVVQVKEVGPGFSISYSSTYTTDKNTKIATIPIGYGDGYPRLLSSKGQMLIKGQRAQIAGKVCMDHTMLDVGDIDSSVEVGDEVVVFGRQGNSFISVKELAQICSTINYEIITSIMARIPRIYV